MRVGLYVAKREEVPPSADPVFTEAEREYCRGRYDPGSSLAARYAAKRAGALALGLDIPLSAFEVTREPGRPPSLRLDGEARRIAEGRERAHLSLSHSGGYAVALVVME